ncbi:MAG: hypothetical protein NTW50_05005 [Candidatus Berkelbacteria bacterium]|nr:hypothetical protein [Candidatus Berkelbacteria bacterium]
MSEIFQGNAVEGESYVGKSTSLEAIREIGELRERGIIIVPEYSVVGPLPTFPRESIGDLKSAIQQIIDLEKMRTDHLLNELEHNKDGTIIFDRGPVSCIAFEYAAERSGYAGATLWMVEAFQNEIENKNIIVPEGVIYLTASKDIIEKRERKSIESGKGRIIDFLRDPGVISSLNEAFAVFGKSASEQFFLTLDTGNKSPDKVALEILQFISNQQENIESQPDFLSYAQSLIKKND